MLSDTFLDDAIGAPYKAGKPEFIKISQFQINL